MIDETRSRVVYLDCIDLFDGVPLVVAQAILRNMEPAHAAIDMAVRCSPKVEVH